MYEPVIGLEVHVELNTESKMFCRCSADYFGKEPNTYTCPVCLGLPGSLPYINQKAIEKCTKIGLALNCKVAEKSFFERKNYFYPDLAKGYQISQYRWPLCVNGWIEVDGKDGVKKIRINRVHQEEDTGKLSHLGGVTLVDFNRSGVPLVEIVTEPDFTNAEEIRDYAKKLQQLFRYLGVSNADMEKGEMRLEANVSVRKKGDEKIPDYRVELKNINSFRFIIAAVEYEIKRQIESLEKGEILIQETRGWDEDKKCTYLQRSKEAAHDYRYFPEPDLPPLLISKEKIKKLKAKLPELPWEKAERFQKMGIKKIDAQKLVEDVYLTQFFEQTIEYALKQSISAQSVANYLINKKVDINSSSPAQIIAEIKSKRSGKIADEEQLKRLARQSMEDNLKAVEDYRKGKEAAIQVLVGGVMKKTSGKADVAKLKEILTKMIKYTS